MQFGCVITKFYIPVEPVIWYACVVVDIVVIIKLLICE